MRTVTGLFDSYNDASRAVRELHAAGIANADISLVTADHAAAVPKSAGKVAEDIADGTEGGAGIGVVLGGAGGLLAGLGILAIPGIGPVIAGGWLLATAVGAAAGAIIGGAAGGIVGALVAAGVPEADAHVYSEGVRRGGTLVTARVEDDRADQAKSILDDNDSIDINERRAAYVEQGWSGFDDAATPIESPAQPYRDPLSLR